MKNGMYCILDKVACEYGPIFEAKNKQVANRSYQNILSQSQTPEDFDLYVIGEIDHDTAEVILCPATKVVVTTEDSTDE